MTSAGAGLEFHFVDAASAEIYTEFERLRPLGYRIEGAPFDDPLQGVRGLFLHGQHPRLELLQPLPGAPAGVLSPWMERGAKLYHLAYEVVVLRDEIDRMRDEGAKLVVPPLPAVAFEGREIAFVMLRNTLLVELIAKG